MRVNLNESRQAVGPHETTLTLNPEAEASFKQHVFPHMEIEVMQGSRIELSNGQIEYRFLLEDEMASALRKALVSIVFPTTNN